MVSFQKSVCSTFQPFGVSNNAIQNIAVSSNSGTIDNRQTMMPIILMYIFFMPFNNRTNSYFFLNTVSFPCIDIINITKANHENNEPIITTNNSDKDISYPLSKL